MPSKLEALRNGETVEIEDGVYGKLDPSNKTMQLSNGRILRIGDNPDYFPKNEKERKVSQETQKLQREISEFPLGESAGQFAYQFGQKGSVTGGIGDWVERLTSTGENYLAKKEAKNKLSSQISEESPYLSMGATAASFVPDIALTRGMSATKAVPALTALGSGSRVLDEPGEVALESALGAAGGFLLDKGGQFLSRTAARRGQSRAIGKEAEEVAARNIEGKIATDAENLARQRSFEQERGFIQRENQARQHQFNLERVEKEREMIDAKNAYEIAKANHLAETDVLKREYEVAQQEYKNALKDMPKRQVEAQRDISKRASKYYDTVADEFPEKQSFNTQLLGSGDFVENNIRLSSLGATKEGRDAAKIIQGLFAEGEEITGKELASRLRILDEVIETTPKEIQIVLDQFKRSLGTKIRDVVADNIIYRESLPIIKQSIKSDVRTAFSDFNVHPVLGSSKSELSKIVEDNIEKTLSQMPPSEFISKMRSGTLTNDLLDQALPKNRFVRIGREFQGSRLEGRPPPIEDAKGFNLENLPMFRETSAEYQKLYSELAENIENSISNAEVKSFQAASKARRKVSRNFRESYGIAEDIPSPVQPIAPQYPTPPLPPEKIAMPSSPVPEGLPSKPIQTSFSPEAIPTLGKAQGVAERAGDLFEKPMMEYFKGKGPFGTGTLGKLAGLKYLMGPKTGALLGGYGVAKGLTSPTAGGEIFRDVIQQGGILGIVQNISNTFSSYDKGVLKDPRERTVAVSEIEQNPEIGIQEKALLQTYINRGKSLESLGELYGR